MDFDLAEAQASWKAKGESLGRELARDPAAAGVVMGAARVGLLDPRADPLAVAVAVEAMAYGSPSAAAIFALHSGTALAVAGDDRFSAFFRGEIVAAVGLSSDDVPVERDGRLSGRAAWVAPVTDRGVAVVGPGRGEDRAAFAVSLDAPGVTIEPVGTAGLQGLACGHITFTGAECTPIGATIPIMTRIRVLMAAVGLGIGRRALREALRETLGRRRHSTVRMLVSSALYVFTEGDAAKS